MVEKDKHFLKGKIISGVLAQSSRNFLLNTFSLTANFVLTVLFSPEIFGIFFLVSAVISFLAYFSDIGLAAALIQKKDEPTREELVSVFTLQQILVILICSTVFYFSPIIGTFYKLDSSGIFLLQSLLISFILSSLKTIPSIILERKLEFGLLAIPNIAETFVYYTVTVVLAFMNFGVLSFAWAALIRGVIGLILIYMIAPWKIGVGFDLKSLRRLLSYGIPFQASSLLALVKDDLMTLFIGRWLPLNEVGYIGWAKRWAESILRVVMDSVIRVTFPAFARLQDNRELMVKTLEKTSFYLAFFIFPATALLVILMGPLIHLIPRYIKWEPALLSFYLFAFSSVFAAFSSPMVNAINALGKIKTTLILMIMWTVLTWIFIPILILSIGYHAVSVTAALISFTSIIPVLLLKKMTGFGFFRSVYKPFISTAIMSVPVYIFMQGMKDWFGIFTGLLLAVGIYIFFVWIWMIKEVSYLYLTLLTILQKISKRKWI